MRLVANAWPTLFCLFALLAVRVPTKVQSREVYLGKAIDGPPGTLLISTIDGQLTAVDAQTGAQKWAFREGPLLDSPTVVQRGFTFIPDPRDGQLYLVVEGRLAKTPFTIPHLVRAAPCKSSDGIFYAGSKKDVWISVDLETGERRDTFAEPSVTVCPANNMKAVHIGKTEYHIQMVDTTKSNERRWNATFVDYSSHLLPEDAQYPLEHYTSAEDGRVLTADRHTGTVLWQRDFGTVIVNMYLLKGDGMHKLPSTAIGRHTFDILAQHAVVPWGVDTLLQAPARLPDRLFQTLYIGATSGGTYALPAFVDAQTNTLAPKYLGPPLLEAQRGTGQNMNQVGRNIRQTWSTTQGESAPSAAADAWPRGRQTPLPADTSPTFTREGTEFLVLGHHQLPAEVALSDQLAHVVPTLPQQNRLMLDYKREEDPWQKGPHGNDGKAAQHDVLHTPRELYALVLALAIALLVMTGTAFYWRGAGFGGATDDSMARRRTVSSASTVTTAHGSDAEEASRHSQASMATAFGGDVSDELLPQGWHRVDGKLKYNSRQVLGKGCDGTVVYGGEFDGRAVAVKRVQLSNIDSEVQRFVEREVAHLRESDSHPNVVRYFCTQSDRYFSYIALELCEHTLEDYVREKRSDMGKALKLELLRQATEGIAHLHSIKIVHRDVKPKNILINGVGAEGRTSALRVKISDFGLCKRVKFGHNSVSRMSGVVGTEGWMAPELLGAETSVTYAVDVFSLGCVFYYVLTGGDHPFGEPYVRTHNIDKDLYNLSRLADEGEDHTSRSLIEAMLRHSALQRPCAAAIKAHPMFWDRARQLQFLLEVSDRTENLDKNNVVMRRLEWRRTRVVGNWLDRIDELLQLDLKRQRSYYNSMRDLLRAIRNKKHHYQELSPELRSLLGRVPDEFLHYFTSRFPQLLLHAFVALNCCARESVFLEYYPCEELCAFYEGERNKWMTSAEPFELAPARRSASPENWRSRERPRGEGATPSNPPAIIANGNIPSNVPQSLLSPVLPSFDPSVPPPPILTNTSKEEEERRSEAEAQAAAISVVTPQQQKSSTKAKRLANKRKRRKKAPFSVLMPNTDEDDDDAEDEGEEEGEGKAAEA